MSANEIKALERHLYEEHNKGQSAVLAAIDELYAIDTIQHSSSGQDIHGIEKYRQHVSAFSSAFPDLHFTVEDMIAARATVYAR